MRKREPLVHVVNCRMMNIVPSLEPDGTAVRNNQIWDFGVLDKGIHVSVVVVIAVEAARVVGLLRLILRIRLVGSVLKQPICGIRLL